MGLAHLVIWNLHDSQTTIDELRAKLPELPEGAYWISNEPQERFGVLAVGELPDLVGVQQLIGSEPAVAEEFDTFD
jgi:hypothetical protein